MLKDGSQLRNNRYKSDRDWKHLHPHRDELLPPPQTILIYSMRLSEFPTFDAYFVVVLFATTPVDEDGEDDDEIANLKL